MDTVIFSQTICQFAFSSHRVKTAKKRTLIPVARFAGERARRRAFQTHHIVRKFLFVSFSVVSSGKGEEKKKIFSSFSRLWPNEFFVPPRSGKRTGARHPLLFPFVSFCCCRVWEHPKKKNLYENGMIPFDSSSFFFSLRKFSTFP